MKICDLTQFYSPLSGGVKRYLHEKIAFVQNFRPHDEHVLIVPGSRDEVLLNERSRTYTIHSPLVSRTTRYRALLNLRAVGEIIEREQPDIIESADPYQLSWAATKIGQRQRIPVVAFYHSHFAEAYLRKPAEHFGHVFAERWMRLARTYTRNLYNKFAVTFVPSRGLADVLQSWGVRNTRVVSLGVDTSIFRPANDALATRATLIISSDRKLLLYVGRLAPEKNTRVLFEAFEQLTQRNPGEFHLLVIGDGPERTRLQQAMKTTGAVTWISYCAEADRLASYYRAADLFVHPGVEETFGLAALESQACGTSVIGIRGSFMDEVIAHDQADWPSANSPDALAEAVEAMCARDLGSLGRLAAERVARNFAWPQVFEREFSICREVCASYKSA